MTNVYQMELSKADLMEEMPTNEPQLNGGNSENSFPCTRELTQQPNICSKCLK